MATNGKFLSKDGQWYDTAQEMWSANAAWNEKQGIQKEQNRLIQQQNQLLEQQSMLNYQIEQEKIQKNYELEMNKMKHEEKMRLLKLFDDVGISKEIYDNYINTNILNKETEKLQAKRDKHLLMSSKYDFLLHEDEHYEELEYDAYDSTMEKYDLYDLKAELMDDECYDTILSKDKQKEKENLETDFNKAKLWFKRGIILLLINVLLIKLTSIEFLYEQDWLIYIIVMSFSLDISVLLPLSGVFMYSFSKSLDKFPTKTFSKEKYFAKINKLILKEQEAANKITSTLKYNNESLVSKFYDFRIKHYNANIEKLLIDAGYKELVESLGIKYQTVNNSNKKHNGTVEDYIEYLETNS